MKRIAQIICTFILIISFQVNAQKDSTEVLSKKQKKELKKLQNFYNPLSPSKAAFYSAVIPGGGQIYNKKYWKAPIVWAAMGTSIYFYLDNNSEYKRYRRAFKTRNAGFQDEFTLDDGNELISTEGLVRAQKTLQNNRDLSLLTTVIFYVLQIVEASVNAHLLQFNTNDNLSFKPLLINNQLQTERPIVGLNFKYKF